MSRAPPPRRSKVLLLVAIVAAAIAWALWGPEAPREVAGPSPPRRTAHGVGIVVGVGPVAPPRYSCALPSPHHMIAPSPQRYTRCHANTTVDVGTKGTDDGLCECVAACHRSVCCDMAEWTPEGKGVRCRLYSQCDFGRTGRGDTGVLYARRLPSVGGRTPFVLKVSGHSGVAEFFSETNFRVTIRLLFAEPDVPLHPYGLPHGATVPVDITVRVNGADVASKSVSLVQSTVTYVSPDIAPRGPTDVVDVTFHAYISAISESRTLGPIVVRSFEGVSVAGQASPSLSVEGLGPAMALRRVGRHTFLPPIVFRVVCPTATGSLEGHWVSLRSASPDLITVLEGSRAHINATNAATFSHTVVRFAGPTATVWFEASMAPCGLRQRFSMDLAVSLIDPEGPLDPVDPVRAAGHVGISIVYHACPECLGQQLGNIHRYAPRSVVYVYDSSRSLTELPTSPHPRAYLSPSHVPSSTPARDNYMSLFKHMDNADRMFRDGNHSISHVVFLASNELFVRDGLEGYVQRHDMVAMAPPTHKDGILYSQWCRKGIFHATRDVVLSEVKADGIFPSSRQWGHEAVKDPRLRHAMQTLGASTVPSSVVYFEGTFLSRAAAGPLLDLLRGSWAAGGVGACSNVMGYPTSGVWPAALLPPATHCWPSGRYKCGQRVSAMMWCRDGRHKRFEVTVEDVEEVRASASELPFSVGRVNRNMSDPVRVHILRRK